MKTMLSLFMIGLMFLTGCSGGGGDEPASIQSEAPTPRSPQPQPAAQPDMLTVTSQGILRGKANGQGQREILREPMMNQSNVFMDQGNIVYQRTGQTVDVWTVKTDGTGDRALLNTSSAESVQGVSWPWVVFTDSSSEVFYESLNTGTQATFPLAQNTPGVIRFRNGRVMIFTDDKLASDSFTGTDPIIYARTQALEDPFEFAAIVEEMLVYRPSTSERPMRSSFASQLMATPLSGGTPIQLDSGQYFTWGGSIGSRVVYARCPFVSGQGTGPCDVASVLNDGTSLVVLTSHPANEAVQGVTTNQVIIRRNLSGNDQLIAVPVTGGAETLLMTMTDNEFVETVVEDTLIVRRPSGTWSLTLSGTLKQLNNIAGLDGFVPVGNAICSSDPVWCMPLDGSTPAVKIADTGKVLGTL